MGLVSVHFYAEAAFENGGNFFSANPFLYFVYDAEGGACGFASAAFRLEFFVYSP